MTDVLYEIPELERLLRDVTGRCFVELYGTTWLPQLSRAVQAGVQSAAQRARTQRPGEALDDWDAAGLGEISKATDSDWESLKSRFGAVWATREEARVDLDRLRTFRDKTLHAVGPSIGAIQRSELRAMILRLRIGLEGVRRSVLKEEGEWWPYIEAINSGVESFNGTRSQRPRPAQLDVGDLVTFEVVGINPLGDQDSLLYKLTAEGPGLSGEHNVWWKDDPHFQVQVPRTRQVSFHLFVADQDDLENNDEWVCSARVRPR